MADLEVIWLPGDDITAVYFYSNERMKMRMANLKKGLHFAQENVRLRHIPLPLQQFDYSID